MFVMSEVTSEIGVFNEVFVVPLNVVCSVESLLAAHYYVVSWQVMKLV